MKKIEAPRLGESYQEEVLPNGLTIRVVPKPGFSKKYAFLSVNYGSIDTQFSKNGERFRTPDGVAHYLEHKMFDLEEENAMQLFAAAGASPNAFTSYDMTAYYFSCTDRFGENLETLLKLAAKPWFTEESVNKEREIIAQEIRMYDDSADSKLYENLFSVLYTRHPVRVPIAGTAESIAEITPETLYRCTDAFYAPSNLMLCVVGDVEAETVAETAARIFPETRSPLPERDYGGPEEGPCERHEIRQSMEIAMPMFAVGFRCAAPKRGSEGIRQEIVGDLACELLAGESSDLYQRLYEENLIDADFTCGYECVKGAALVSFSGDSEAPERVRDEILDECRRMLREGLPEDLFRQLKKSAMGRRVRDLDSFESICYRMSACFFDGADYFGFPAVYDEVTLEDIRAFLSETLREDRMVLSVIEPKERVQ